MQVRARHYFLALVLACCAGCAVRQQTMLDPDALAALAGRWRLDSKASDDVRARLMPLFERNERRWRRRVEPFDQPPPGVEPGPNTNDETFSNVRWLQGERQKEIQVLIAMFSPATQLDIQVDGRTVRIATDKGEGTRALTPGESSALFLNVGGFKVESEWKEGALLVESRGTEDNKLRIEERFAPVGDRLDKRLEVRIPGIGKQVFNFVYRR